MFKSFARVLMGSSIVAALVVSLGTATPASAQKNHPLRRAEKQQRNEIRNGVKTGKLTKQQAAKLSQQEKYIDAVAKKDSKDPNAADRATVKRDVLREQQDIKGVEDKNATSTTPAANPSSPTPQL